MGKQKRINQDNPNEIKEMSEAFKRNSVEIVAAGLQGIHGRREWS